MARDRKRAKQRQRRRTADRQPQRVSARRDADAAPPPLEDASAEVEIAEAAMVDPPEAELEAEEAPAPDELAGLDDQPAPDEPAPDELEEIDGQPDDRSAVAAATGRDEPTSLTRGPAARAVSGAELPAEGNRFANFLRACAAELRRVQWPDRRQVAQATGVVLGFVILAGAYLGALDAAFSRLVNAIL